ncbi:MAG TPA: arylesterase [Vicinamibacterales bacterium]|nr:arylesterase [Vicinamibacterales bacterium]
MADIASMHAPSVRWPAALLLGLALTACAEERPGRDTPAAEVQAATPAPRPRIVVLGDSLTAGLGLPRDEAFPSHLQRRIDAAGLRYEVVNAGVSGDTSSGGLRRLDWALDGDVRILIVALGGNDGLRGVPVEELRRNLEAIVERAQARGVSVVLAGMAAPPNQGRDYAGAFRQVYRDLARRHRLPLVPFLLEGVAGDPAFNQEDGIHPNAAGAARVADNVWRVLRPLLEPSTDD